ncbi:MmpS family transport accessory protein [Mycobacterium sp.]|uniref:MmpS family transport accessory protein n=1 Tax=Mycobacterium sp. TaxID=1785 RepID=UPI002B68EDAF|nr:MmpS family transport accessory protein [Mycobacterium sp.]HTY31146.1 MmpS family transport accessory protein [Mycobacterium sp.]HUO38052.1 MmpS family transport accessory protein [Mycobacterium sp.]HUO38077.1 MmpS family transport accessory protein [Mycobacterium sp.]
MTSHLRGPSILFALGIGFANICGGTVAVAGASDNPQVRYEVSGPGVAEYISYQTDSGQQRAVNAKLPWSTQFTGFGGEVFVLSAQGPGPINCKILMDGNVVSDATATVGTPARTVCTH